MDISNLVGVGKQMTWYDPEMVARTGLIGTQQNAGNLANQQTDWSNQRTRNFSNLISKAYDPVSRTINYNKLNDFAASAGLTDAAQAKSLEDIPKQAQAASDIAGNNFNLTSYGAKPYTPSWANQPMNQSTAKVPPQVPSRQPLTKDTSASGEKTPHALLTPPQVPAQTQAPLQIPTEPGFASVGAGGSQIPLAIRTSPAYDSQGNQVGTAGDQEPAQEPYLPGTTPYLPGKTRLSETTPYLPGTTPYMPGTTPYLPGKTRLSETTPYLPGTTPINIQNPLPTNGDRSGGVAAPAFSAANAEQDNQQFLSNMPAQVPAPAPAQPAQAAQQVQPAQPAPDQYAHNADGSVKLDADGQPLLAVDQTGNSTVDLGAGSITADAPSQAPAQQPQSYWDYLETLHPDASAMLGNAGGQGQGSTLPLFQLPPNAPGNIVSAYGWKLAQDANAGLGAPANGKAYTVDEVNAGLANVEKAAAATVMSPMWAAVPHRDEKTGRLMPPDPQAVAKARADYAANEAKVITELGKTYGPAFAEKFKMDMDVVKTEMEKGKYDKEIKTANAENVGLNQFASNLTTVGKESNLSGAVDPMTFENKAAMDKFSTQLSAYSKIKDWPKSAAEAVTFAKNVSVAEDMPESEAMLNLMTVIGANPSDRAALAMMMQRDGGVSSAVGAAFGQFLANNLTSRPAIGEFKQGMAFQNIWRGHTGASGTAPTFGDTSSPVPTADEGKAAGSALVPPPPAGSWYNTPLNNALISKTGVHYNVTQRDANGNATNVVDMLNHPHAVTNVPGSPNVAIEPWQDQPMSQPTGPTNRSARRRAARARTNTKSTAKDPLGLGI